jgi:acetoin utilization deacetylase AcuC-like enzyme
MDATERLRLYYDARVQSHQPDGNAAFLPNRVDKRVRQLLSGLAVPWKYPEHPGRLTAVLDYLAASPIPGMTVHPGRAATHAELSRVHTTSYLNEIAGLRGQNAWLDVDTTAVSPGSIEAAEVAAGATICAVEAIVRGDCKSAFALVRPPGHHAEPVRARGFCLFNNVAVAAAHAQNELGCERVLILDWDAHHGNGSQEIFWADPDVLFVDVHREAPFYPGSGKLDEIGAGLGEGTTVNIPLPAGSGDTAYLRAIDEILRPAADWFQPDLILVSAGFDAHWMDLALNLSYEGFGALTGRLLELAERHCQGRLAFVLEGGYNLDSLPRCIHAVLSVLAGEPPPEPGIRGVAEVLAAADFHRQAFAAPDD